MERYIFLEMKYKWKVLLSVGGRYMPTNTKNWGFLWGVECFSPFTSRPHHSTKRTTHLVEINVFNHDLWKEISTLTCDVRIKVPIKLTLTNTQTHNAQMPYILRLQITQNKQRRLKIGEAVKKKLISSTGWYTSTFQQNVLSWHVAASECMRLEVNLEIATQNT